MWVTEANQYGLINKEFNSRSITEEKVVSVNYTTSKILWTNLFIEDQGYNAENDIFMKITKVLSS